MLYAKRGFFYMLKEKLNMLSKEDNLLACRRGKNTHIELYDYIRLFAILCVVLAHSSYITMPAAFGGVDYSLPSNLSSIYNSAFMTGYRQFIKHMGSFTLELFFALSGAVFALKAMPTFDNIVVSKIKRLLVPYYMAGLFFMLPIKFISRVYDKSGLLKAVKVFWWGGEAGHLWFLCALFWCFIFCALVHKVLKYIKVESVWIPLFLSMIVTHYYEAFPIEFFGTKQAAMYFLYFNLGYAFEVWRKQFRLDEMRLLYVIIALVIVFAFLWVDDEYHAFTSVVRSIFYIFFVLLLSLLCMKIAAKCNRKLPSIISRNLFNIYLFHDPLNYLILNITFLHSHLLENGAGVVLYFLLRNIGVCVASILIGEAIKYALLSCRKALERSHLILKS